MNETTHPFLIYGAYGYTGKIILDECQKRGIRPFIAGRDEAQLKEVADKYRFPWKAFSLDDADVVASIIEPFEAILHCAGPFVHTALPVLNACLKTNTHYLDITGEIQVFELAASMNQKFVDAGIVALPGAGFDVVPSDCMAAYIHSKLPDANKLRLSIYSKGGVSRGTALTMVENIDKGGAVRKDGRIKTVPAAWKKKDVDFGDKTRTCVTIPWGDVSTAWHSTGIPDIEVYMCLPAQAMKMMTLNKYFGFLLRRTYVKNFLKKRVKSGSSGPSERSRLSGETRIVAEASNESGKSVAALLTGPEGYTLTAITALDTTLKILENKYKPGFYTPSKLFGADYILQFEGTTRTDI